MARELSDMNTITKAAAFDELYAAARDVYDGIMTKGSEARSLEGFDDKDDLFELVMKITLGNDVFDEMNDRNEEIERKRK